MSILLFFWNLLGVWVAIFIAPFRSFDVLWITIPIWLSWFFADYFQEKQTTSFGNVVSNGIIPLWVGLDWSRFLIEQILESYLFFSVDLVVKFLLCLSVLAYGVLIIYCGFKAKKIIRVVGRIREVTYVLLMFTPIIYGVLDLTWYVVLAILVYAPLWYFGLELLFK